MRIQLSRMVFSTVISIIILETNGGYSQGCSDAGFCTLNALKPTHDSTLTSNQNYFKTGLVYGKADHRINTLGHFVEIVQKANEKLSLELKLTNLYQRGNDISTFGLSDIYLTGNYTTHAFSKALLGVKIPTNGANKRRNGISLPMDYQSSLGTLDIIMGFGYAKRNARLAVALQQPITQNRNQFINNIEMNSRFNEFQSTNSFKRSGDALIRASYVLINGKKLMMTPGLLSIYHIANDRYTNALGTTEEISGSKGLTLNATLFVDYAISSNNFFQISFGTPLLAREARPDGLTRSFVVSCEYRINF